MNNAFDSDNYSTVEPLELVIGARWAWKRPDVTSVYETTAYTLKYVFSDLEGTKNFEITASKIASAHVVEVPIATTATRKAGDYKWSAVVVRDSDSEEVTIDEGHATIKSKTGDIASHVYKTLMAIRSSIQGKATKDQLSYSINGRSLQRYSLKELHKLEVEYTRRYKKEQDAIDRKNGRKGKSRVLTKLGA